MWCIRRARTIIRDGDSVVLRTRAGTIGGSRARALDGGPRTRARTIGGFRAGALARRPRTRAGTIGGFRAGRRGLFDKVMALVAGN